MAAWLQAQSSIGALGVLLTGVGVAALTWPGGDSMWASVFWGVVALAGIAERVLWLRLRLDADLFRGLALGAIESLVTLDGALEVLKLRRRADTPPRALDARLHGTRRLVNAHAVVVVVQTVLAAMVVLLPKWLD